jgi:glutamate-1-semialdehyde aminotransferase
LPSIKEVILAEMVKETIKCIEKVKFLKTGSAACEMAVRFARAHTIKLFILWSGYHGTHDTFIGQEYPGSGCIRSYSKKFSSISKIINYIKEGDALIKNNIAAVMVEPVILDATEKHINSLRELKTICAENNILLIFDEIVTGFRYLDYTVSNYYDIQPDLICLGKALGNGYPISILGGEAVIMDNPDVFCSNTHNGEITSLSQSIKTLDFLKAFDMKGFWKTNEDFLRNFNRLCTHYHTDFKLIGIPVRWTWKGDWNKIALFWQEMCKKGYLIGKSVFPRLDWSHNFYSKFLNDSESTMQDMSIGIIRLEGKLPTPVFERY